MSMYKLISDGVYVHDAGPVLIPSFGSFDTCDKYQGVYFDYGTFGVFMLGMTYIEARKKNTIAQLAQYFGTKYLARSYTHVAESTVPYVVDGVTRTVPLRRRLRSVLLDAPLVAITRPAAKIFAVPHSAVDGFGLVNSGASGDAATAMWGTSTAPIFAPWVNYSENGGLGNLPHFRYIVPVALNVSRRAFLLKLAEQIEDYSTQSEVKTKVDEAVAGVLAVLPNPDAYLPVFVSFVHYKIGASWVRYVDYPHNSGINVEHCQVMTGSQYSQVAQQHPAGTMHVGPTGRIRGGSLNLSLPAFPVQCSSGRKSEALIGFRGGTTSKGGTLFSIGVGKVARTTADSGLNYAVPDYGSPLADFGCGHMSNISGPLGYAMDFVAGALSTPANVGGVSFSDWFAEYQLCLGATVAQTQPNLTSSTGTVLSEDRQGAGLATLASTAYVDGAETTPDLDVSVGYDPRVIATMFALSMDGDLTPQKLAAIHASLGLMNG